MTLLFLSALLIGGELVCAEMARKKCSPFDEPPPDRTNTSERLGMLRAEMKRAHSVQGAPLEAYIVPSYDYHLNELVAERDRRLEFVTGFTGSHGLAVVTEEKAAFWTSDIFLTQANLELSCEWSLMNESTSVTEWIGKQVQPGLRIGADPKSMPNSQWEQMAKELNAKSIYLIPIHNNLVDLIWFSKPNYTFHEAIPLIYENSGETWFTKVSQVRTAMKAEDCDALVVTALDEIAWLLNIRGRDTPYTPVLRAYLIMAQDQIHLYTDRAKINEKIKTRLRIEGCYTSKCVRLHGYDIIWEDLSTMSQKWNTVCLPTETTGSPGVSRAVFYSVPVVKRKSLVSPILLIKAEKSEREREGMMKAHMEDAVAVIYTMAHIKNKMRAGEKLDELMLSDLFESARRERTESEGISFRSTVAFGIHSSLPRYQPRNSTSIEVNRSSLLLVSSGGQYLGGTTEVSRTFHFGKPTDEEKEVYTRVLMGLIDFSKFVFPETLKINELDFIARQHLWASGRDYMHETGHGIGSFLSVSEGPILLSRNQNDDYTFKEGYFLSVEPGFYKEDQFGIRLGNVLQVVNKSNNGQKYLGFETVTLVPFEPDLVKPELLGPDQVSWLNEYNSRIRNEVGNSLKDRTLMGGFYWMMEKVNHIPQPKFSFNSSNSLFIQPMVFLFIEIGMLLSILKNFIIY